MKRTPDFISVAWAAALLVIVCCAMPAAPAAEKGPKPMKTHSVFYSADRVKIARANAAKYGWAKEARGKILRKAEPWVKMSDDKLWGLMFGNTITRSWHVWSNGHCPACKKSVPMYNWKIDAVEEPWKVHCPHCGERFPKNDFRAFYRSGLDERGVFDPKRANRALLVNAEHRNPRDPLHKFGVDDGEGYVDGNKRWRFIGAYLVYGQWKQLVVGGIKNLAAAYAVTGKPAYAHKAAILLDRVADLYPTFDFHATGMVYERPGDAGYVSTWHDACEETRDMALAYDQIFERMKNDRKLVAFLSKKAKRLKLDNPKSTLEDIQRNIEDGLLQDPLRNPGKIHSNYPRAETCKAILMTVLDWPNNRDEVNGMIDAIVKKSTAVDGVTGEKGLAGYASFTIAGLATFLARYADADPTFLEKLFGRHPPLRQTYRFHIDTWCLGQYYPQSGDVGSFAKPMPRYAGVKFKKSATLAPSMYTFLWKLYKLTDDAAYVQVIYGANDGKVKGLPHDLFAADPRAMQKETTKLIARDGPMPKLGSVDKQGWCIAILRSGEGPSGRAAWLDYDSRLNHCHLDAMNVGLFAKGLDLMPDFGYPPVQFGGWGGPKFEWYVSTAAHNTVVIDGKNQSRSLVGATTLWADGEVFRAIRASLSGRGQFRNGQYERTIATVDISDEDFYLLDVFRVLGGRDHAKFMQSHFGAITTTGLTLSPAPDYGHGTQMRNFKSDPAPRPGWSVDWKIDDVLKLLPPRTEVHLRYTDLTSDARAATCEGWIVKGSYNSTDETWIPRVMVRRQTEKPPLQSTFVAVIEPYGKESNITSIRRLTLSEPAGTTYPDTFVAVEVRLRNERRDLFLTADVENPLGQTPSLAQAKIMVQKDWDAEVEGEAAFIRKTRNGAIERIVLCRGRSIRVGDVTITLKDPADHLEVRFERNRPIIAAGDADKIEDIRIKGKSVGPR